MYSFYFYKWMQENFNPSLNDGEMVKVIDGLQFCKMGDSLILTIKDLKNINNKGFFKNCKDFLDVRFDESLDNIKLTKELFKFSNIINIDFSKVISLEDQCFNCCNELVDITLPHVEDIPFSCFAYCNKLKNVILPNLKKLQSSAFSHSNLENIQLSNMVTIISEYCFYNCCNLRNFTFDKIDKVEIRAFNNTGLENIYINNDINNNTITLRKFSFANTFNLETVEINRKCILEPGVFINSNLETVKLSNVEIISSECFSGCYNLRCIEAPKLIKIETNAFKDCPKLVNINNNILTNVEICKSAFDNCLITQLTLNNCKFYKNSFINCNKLKNIIYENNTKMIIDSYDQSENSIKKIDRVINYCKDDNTKLINNCKLIYSPNFSTKISNGIRVNISI